VNHYCTYFDSNYLAQGLALWRSLARHDPGAVLWVLALDAASADVLRGLPDPQLRVFLLADLLAADAELAAVRAARPRNEFIFTLTPCLVRWLLQTHPDTRVVAYLDADLYFFSDPAPVWRELGDGSVLVVAHRYPAWHDDAARYGKFNVGVLAFRDDVNGRNCLDWWRTSCLHSCALAADGKVYGDQKYLDEWPRLVAGVVTAAHPGINVAPWNWAGHRFELLSDAVRVDGALLVVFHFAQFRRISPHWFDSGQLEYGIMPLRLRSRLYGEYWVALVAAEAEIRRARPDFSLPSRGWSASLGAWHLALLRLFWGQYWLRLGSWWLAGRLGLGWFSGRAMAVYRHWQRQAP
jgi:hypothetical protein